MIDWPEINGFRAVHATRIKVFHPPPTRSSGPRLRYRMSSPHAPAIVIPARMTSTRLPGKPLADIAGEPMIVHVWRRACEADIGRVIVACSESEVADAVRDHGGEAVMTRPDHQSGSDRIFEAMSRIDSDQQIDAVINLQGDLPLIDAIAIRASLAPLAGADVDIATLVAEIVEAGERDDPNVVKAIVSFDPVVDGDRARTGRALYFTRATAPSGEGPLYHHIGLYAFRRTALERFVELPPSTLERRERLEQLRALEAGMWIDAVLVDSVPVGVDTPADLARVRQLFAAKQGDT